MYNPINLSTSSLVILFKCKALLCLNSFSHSSKSDSLIKRKPSGIFLIFNSAVNGFGCAASHSGIIRSQKRWASVSVLPSLTKALFIAFSLCFQA